jgi:hypothetical protein
MAAGEATLGRGPSGAEQGDRAARKRGAVRAAGGRKRAPKVSGAQLRDLLDQALAAVDADDEAGSQLRATGLRARLRVPDLGVVVDVEPSEEGTRHLSWTFAAPAERKPKLELIMDSEAANAWLQGRESLAVAMARNRARYKGDARCALHYLPALRGLAEAYRRLVRDRYPQLAI